MVSNDSSFITAHLKLKALRQCVPYNLRIAFCAFSPPTPSFAPWLSSNVLMLLLLYSFPYYIW